MFTNPFVTPPPPRIVDGEIQLSLFKKYFRNESGSVTIMVGLAAFLTILCIGTAIDMSRAQTVKAHLQSALDEAGLAGAISLNNMQGQTDPATWARNHALQSFAVNFPNGTLNTTPIILNTSLSADQQIFTVSAGTSQATAIMPVFGVNSVNIGTSAVVSIHNPSCLYVVDANSGQIDKFDSNANFLQSFPLEQFIPGNVGGDLSKTWIHSVAVDKHGNMWMLIHSEQFKVCLSNGDPLGIGGILWGAGCSPAISGVVEIDPTGKYLGKVDPNLIVHIPDGSHYLPGTVEDAYYNIIPDEITAIAINKAADQVWINNGYAGDPLLVNVQYNNATPKYKYTMLAASALPTANGTPLAPFGNGSPPCTVCSATGTLAPNYSLAINPANGNIAEAGDPTLLISTGNNNATTFYNPYTKRVTYDINGSLWVLMLDITHDITYVGQLDGNGNTLLSYPVINIPNLTPTDMTIDLNGNAWVVYGAPTNGKPQQTMIEYNRSGSILNQVSLAVGTPRNGNNIEFNSIDVASCVAHGTISVTQ